jgi:putative FmdB family regulatory protein
VASFEEGPMPMYAYRCLDCGETFERVEHMSDHDDQTRPKCPRCDGEKVVQVFAPFFAQTHKKS